MPGSSPAGRAPSPRPPSSCPSPAAAFTRFYTEQQMAREEARQRVEEELEAQRARECTFRPAINGFDSSRRHEGDQRDTFERLSRDKTETYQRLEEERAKGREKELAECSFQPRTNSAYASARPARDATQLHLEASERQLLIQRRKEEEEAERKTWFQPRINAMSRATVEAEPRPPIHERIDDLQRQKEVLLHRMRAEESQKGAALFRPRINPTSNEIIRLQQRSTSTASDDTGASSGPGQGPEAAAAGARGRARAAEEASAQLRQQCPFRPELSRKTQEIVQQHAAFRSQSFAERQLLFARRSKGKRHTAAQKAAAEESAPFEPTLSPTSVLLTQAKREAESLEEKVVRLAVHDKARAEEARKGLEDEYYQQFPFKPRLNKVSRTLAGGPRADGGVARPKSGHTTEEIRQELEETFQRTCTFQPAILPTSGREGLNASAVSLDPVERERRLAEARREQQYEELKDCTFQPRTKPRVPDFSRQHVAVPGMAQYLDRRCQARQLEEDRKAREEQAFKVRGVPAGRRYTVPKPFNLHTAYHSASRRDKREAQLKARADLKCPFTPHTNAKAAYDILRKYILQDDGDSDDDLQPPYPPHPNPSGTTAPPPAHWFIGTSSPEELEQDPSGDRT